MKCSSFVFFCIKQGGHDILFTVYSVGKGLHLNYMKIHFHVKSTTKLYSAFIFFEFTIFPFLSLQYRMMVRV